MTTLPAPPATLLDGASLFLDLDGTLVEIAANPDAIAVTDDLRGLLTLLGERLDDRVAILTGRAVRDVERMLTPTTLTVAGSHGLELPNASPPERPAYLDEVVERFRAIQRDWPGVLVEDKPLGVALHYRQAPEAEAICRTAAEAAAKSRVLELQPGKMVFELKLPGSNKGDALRAIMARAPFSRGRPLFLGDDLTDEPGFHAARSLGGAGIVIGEREETAANYRLPAVTATIAWLHRAAEQLP